MQTIQKCLGTLGLLCGAGWCGSWALAQAAPPTEWRGSVRPGDTWMSMERHLLQSPERETKLAEHNRMKSPDHLLTHPISDQAHLHRPAPDASATSLPYFMARRHHKTSP